MDRGSSSPKSEPSQRGGSVDPSSIRPNPFEKDDDTARKRRRTSLNVERSRSLSAESADPDAMTSDSAASADKDTVPSSSIPAPLVSRDSSATLSTHAEIKDIIPMDTTQDTETPATASASTPAQAPARPHTPPQDHEPKPTGTPSNVALRLRNASQQAPPEEFSLAGNSASREDAPTPPPRAQTAETGQPASPKNTQFVDGLAAAVEAASSALALAAQVSDVPRSLESDDAVASPPVEIVDVSSSNDESINEGDAVTLLSQNGTAPAAPPRMVDPTSAFPYYEMNEGIRDHIFRMSGFLLTDDNLARETRDWIEKFLVFAQHSSMQALRQSYRESHDVWTALPCFIHNNLARMRMPGFSLTAGSAARAGVIMFCRSFARLTAHLVEFDTKTSGQPYLVSMPYISALVSLCEKRLLAEEERAELQQVEDDIYATLISFVKYNQAAPNGSMVPLMQLLDAQSRVPMTPQAVDNCFTMIALMSTLSCEFYRKLTRTRTQPNTLAVLNGRLALGFRAFEICRTVFETAMRDHTDFLNGDQMGQHITSHGELLYISSSLNPGGAPPPPGFVTDEWPDLLPEVFPDARVMAWKVNVYSTLVKNSQMTLRLMAVENLAVDLVSFWRRYSDQGADSPVVKYVASQVLASGVVSYFLSPTCHPEVTERSSNVIGFLAISETYTNAETDLFWKSVLSAQDPTNIIKIMADVASYFSYETATYFCQRFVEVPVSAFTAYMRNLCFATFRQLLLSTAPRPESLDEFIPFKVCLHQMRVASAPIEDGTVRYPEVIKFFIERLDDVLKALRISEMTPQRHDLYRACIKDLDAKSNDVLGSLCAITIINRHGGGGIADLDHLMSDKSFTELVVDNLEYAIQSRPTHSKMTVLTGSACHVRRDFLLHMLRSYSAIFTPELSSRVWDLMFGESSVSEADRNSSWEILTNICNQEMALMNNPFLLQAFNIYIPNRLPASCFCEGLLKFLQEWLAPALADPACDLLLTEATQASTSQDTTAEDKDGDSTSRKKANSIALEQLWQIVLTTPANTIENGATQLLVKQVYINSTAIRNSSSENRRMIHMALIERCLRQTSSAAKMLETLSDSRDDEQIREQGLVFLRSVRVLQQFLKEHREVFPYFKPTTPETTLHGESAGLKYQSFDGTKQTEVRALNAGRLNTAGFLFESIKAATGFERCKVYAHGGRFQPLDVTQSLEDLNIHDCLLLVRRDESTTDAEVSNSDSTETTLDVQGAILDHFEELWESLGLSEELASEVYELLVHLDVGDNMFKLFERQGLTYRDVLYEHQPYKSLYALHALREFVTKRLNKCRQSSTTNTTSSLSPQAMAKVEAETRDGSADTLMTTPEDETESKASPTDAVDTPQSKSSDSEGKIDAPEATEAVLASNSAVVTTARLVTGAICDPDTARVPKNNIALQTVLDLKLIQLLGLVLASSSGNEAVREMLDANLLSHLLGMLQKTLDYDRTDASFSLMELLFSTIVDTCSLSRPFWAAFQAHADTKALLARLLLFDDCEPVREMAKSHIGRRAVFDESESTGGEVVRLAEFQQFFLPAIVELVPEAIRLPSKCESIFNLIEIFFTVPGRTEVPLNLETLLSDTAQLLLQYDTLEDATQPDLFDSAMYGLVMMLKLVYGATQGSGKFPPGFVDKVFWKHMFPPWQPESRRGSSASTSINENGDADMPLVDATVSPTSRDLQIVTSSKTRVMLSKLLLDITGDDTKQLRKLVKNLDQLVPAEPAAEEDYIYSYDLPTVYDPSKALRAPCGYVGLYNQSNTCYFNSLLTQLFMNVKFRQFIIQIDPANEDANSMVFQTRLLFSYMQNSARRYLETLSCTNSIKTYDNGPIDISIQMDVDEFFNLLFDRWEAHMPSPTAKRELRSFYGGQIVQQIRSHQCEHVSERLEPFSAIQCDIKGKSSLMESLEAYVEGEVMEGENKYKCSDCNDHVVATKRACLKEVPDHLIFHLKRFEYNLRTGMRNKINDRFSFPHEIDMRPYTIDHLSNPDQEQTPDMFELVGVLVHAGTAESGHYYSFVRERPSIKAEGSWVEFNDDTVNEWDPALMEPQCFGGSDFRPAMAGYGNTDGRTGEMVEKSFSAYMLFYQRRSAVEAEQQAMDKAGLTVPIKVDVVPDVAAHIHRENAQLIRRHALFDPQHLKFVNDVLVQVQNLQPDKQCSSNHVVENRALQMALSHLDQVAMRARDAANYYLELRNHIEAMTKKCSLCSLAVFDYFGARPQVLHQMLQRCPEFLVRNDVAALVIGALINVREAFKQSYYSMPITDTNGSATDEDGDRYMDGIDPDDNDQDSYVDDVSESRTNAMTTQRDPTEMVRKCTIVANAQGLIQHLWKFIHMLFRSWPETFSFMNMFVSMGRAEVAAFMDTDGLRRALEVIMADARLPNQNFMINRMLHNLERRQANRAVSYVNLISLINTVMGGMYVDRNLGDVSQIRIEDNVCRFEWLLRKPDDDLPLLKVESNMLALDWPTQYPGPSVNVFVDKLIGLAQNKGESDAIILRLMRRHPAMRKRVYTAIRAGFDAFSTNSQTPYVRTAVFYIRNVDANDTSGVMMYLDLAEQCRVPTKDMNRRVYFDALRMLYLDSGSRRIAHGETLDDGNDEDAEPRPFNLKLLEENLRIVLIWAPGLLAYYDSAVSDDAAVFVVDVLALEHGPNAPFSTADGGAARTELVTKMARLFGIELLTFLRDSYIMTRMRAPPRSLRLIERIVTLLQPFYIISTGPEVAAEATDGDATSTETAETAENTDTENANAVDAETQSLILQWLQLLPVLTELSGPPVPLEAEGLDDEYESGVDEGDWNDSSSVDEESAGNISMHTGGELDTDIP